MGFDSPIHWLIVIFVIALLFGGSRVGGLMGELGKGLRSFKQNLSEPDEAARPPAAAQVTAQARIAEAPETVIRRETEISRRPIAEPALPPEAGHR